MATLNLLEGRKTGEYKVIWQEECSGKLLRLVRVYRNGILRVETQVVKPGIHQWANGVISSDDVREVQCRHGAVFPELQSLTTASGHLLYQVAGAPYGKDGEFRSVVWTAELPLDFILSKLS